MNNQLDLAPSCILSFNSDFKTEIEYLIQGTFNYTCLQQFTNLLFINKDEVILMSVTRDRKLYNKHNRTEYWR